MKDMLKALSARLKEPSTYAGAGIVATSLLPLVGVPLVIAAKIAAALGGVAMIVKDPGAPDAK